MENQFVTYELAVKLEELGFDEECLASFIKLANGDMYLLVGEINSRVINELNNQFKTNKFKVLTPLWQQAFDWFRDKQNLESSVYWSNNYKDYRFSVDNLTKMPNEGDLISMESKTFNSYEEARYACLEKLIELL